MALLGVLLITLILSILGVVSVNLAMQEIQTVADQRDDAAARYMAEAGLETMMQWFNQPTLNQGQPMNVINKRFDLSDFGPSFFDSSNRSQFSGSSTAPDIFFDAGRPADHQLLNDPTTGWFGVLNHIGEVRSLKLYAPRRPGMLCTLEVTAGTHRALRTVSVQLAALMAPPIRAGVQIGVGNSGAGPLPTFVHWGAVKVNGDQLLPPAGDIPLKTALAAVTDQSYADMSRREDRWFELLIGGNATFVPSPAPPPAFPSNVQQHQEPVPGLHLDRWRYEDMKKYAKVFGTYYVLAQDGLVYRDGVLQAGLGITIDDIMRSQSVDDNRGLVFIDTWDQQPPRPGNLGSLVIDLDYAHGLFVINAHVRFKSPRFGRTVSVLSPPDGAGGRRIPLALPNIHLNGLLHVAGDLSYEGQLRIFGAVVVQGSITAPLLSQPLEVWYNDDFSRGYYPGLPVVYPAPGTWQEKY